MNNNQRKQEVFKKYTLLTCRLVLGLVFVYAAFGKIVDPWSFAETIYNYRILPVEAVGSAALILPWLELVCAALVLTGFWHRPGSAILACLLTVFMAAVGFNLLRGLDFNCGCFGPGGRQAGLGLLLQDGLLLGLAVYLLKYWPPKEDPKI